MSRGLASERSPAKSQLSPNLHSLRRVHDARSPLREIRVEDGDDDVVDADVCTGTESCDTDHLCWSVTMVTSATVQRYAMWCSACQAGTPPFCDDSDIGNGLEFCDATLGPQAGTPLVCDDANACTADSCDSTSGCANEDISDRNIGQQRRGNLGE